MRIRLFKDESGEPRVYAYSINLNRPGDGGLYRSWYLNWPGNSLRVEWSPGRTSLIGLGITFAVTSEYNTRWWIGVPFIGFVSFRVARTRRLLRLLRLDWPQVRDKPMRDWERALKASWHDGALWIDPWVHPTHWSRGYRGSFSINPRNILFGRPKYSEGPRETHDAALIMPEGEYPLRVELYTASWKRPRWPKPKTINRAEVEVLTKGGVPVPGKGENDYDLDDDATYGMTCPAETVEAAVEQLRASVLRDRVRHGGRGWRPERTDSGEVEG